MSGMGAMVHGAMLSLPWRHVHGCLLVPISAQEWPLVCLVAVIDFSGYLIASQCLAMSIVLFYSLSRPTFPVQPF